MFQEFGVDVDVGVVEVDCRKAVVLVGHFWEVGWWWEIVWGPRRRRPGPGHGLTRWFLLLFLLVLLVLLHVGTRLDRPM